ncbi:MAG: rhodanese-like domain-containing protein [Pseudomonadota bacterium]|nr:rhodanese-like domain-containing protein [Pseudomonadota bacterium]
MALPDRSGASSQEGGANACMTGKTPAQESSHAGNVTPMEAFAGLAEGGVLVDVRTPPEWQQGVPDLAKTQGRLVMLSWKLLPEYMVNPDFAQQFAAEKGIGKDTPLYFMCKGGGRSLEASTAMAKLGYRRCFNILGGFEGRPDQPGWKTQLPWRL